MINVSYNMSGFR